MLKELSRRLRQPRHLREALEVIRQAQSRGAGLEDWIDLALDFPSQGNVRVRTVQRRPEILALARAVAELKPARILEIGTYRAGTLLLWTQIASERVVTCDLEIAAHMVPLYEQFPPPRSSCRIRVLQGDSHSPDFRARVGTALGGPVDFLFIDGDHTSEGVRQDYESYRSFVRPGGLIALHDIVQNQPVPGNQVHRFWTQLRAQLPADSMRELIEDPSQCGYGIGLIEAR